MESRTPSWQDILVILGYVAALVAFFIDKISLRGRVLIAGILLSASIVFTPLFSDSIRSYIPVIILVGVICDYFYPPFSHLLSTNLDKWFIKRALRRDIKFIKHIFVEHLLENLLPKGK